MLYRAVDHVREVAVAAMLSSGQSTGQHKTWNPSSELGERLGFGLPYSDKNIVYVTRRCSQVTDIRPTSRPTLFAVVNSSLI
jgi:hypothetical protein